MLGKKILATIVVAAFIAVVPTVAYAAPTIDVAAVPVVSDDVSYVPTQHATPSLDGSAVASSCVDDRPVIHFSVVLTDPGDPTATHTATLVMSGSGNTTSIALGTLGADGRLSGTVPWPGSETGGWPGYKLVDGEWVPTDGNFAWTRGPITTVIQTGTDVSLAVPLSYPPETAACASPHSSADPAQVAASPLAATGSNFQPAPLLFTAGGLIVLGGLTLLIVRRRASRRP